MWEMNVLEQIVQQAHRLALQVHQRADGQNLVTEADDRGGLALITIDEPQASIGPREWERLQTAHPEGVIIGQRYVNARQAERYRQLGIPYLDAAGNAWLDFDGIKVWVEGKPPVAKPVSRAPLPRAFTKTGAKLVFVLLVDDEYATASMRTLAEAANMSLGAVQQAMRDLGHRDYLDGPPPNRTGLRHRDDLITQWTMAFTNRLLPTLATRHVTGPAPEQWAKLLDGTTAGTIAGEANQPTLIRATTTTIYGTPPWAELTQICKLRPAPDDANVILRERFWNEDLLHIGTRAPALLDYAELIASGDPRQREIANELRADHQI